MYAGPDFAGASQKYLETFVVCVLDVVLLEINLQKNQHLLNFETSSPNCNL